MSSPPQNSTQWVDYITDLIRHASSTSDRIAVMEQCKKALQDEAGDTKLWRLYGDWVWLLHKISHNVNGVYSDCTLEDQVAQQPWSQEDAVIGQVVFQWAGMMDVWQQGVKATQWHINDSHLVWDPYIEMLLYDLSTSPSPDKIAQVKSIFNERLRQPHSTWDQTFSSFSHFVSTYDQTQYERIMSDTNAKGQKAKHEYGLRGEREASLVRAERAGHVEEESRIMMEYLEWEESQMRRKKTPPFARDLYSALCERATLRFPTYTEFWLDRIIALMQRPEDAELLLLVAERATIHCPGSGELWQKRLYALEACEKDFHEIADVKHTATSTGLLEDGGNMQELILVEFAWCSYLRRRAFSPTANEEDLDVAEMALRSAIENVWTVGHKKYGKAFKGDPEFRMERIYLKFLAQAGRFEEARKEFRKLEATHGDSHYFWERWYMFEMTVYDGRFDQDSRASKDFLPPPRFATDALQRAIKRPNLDYPEKVIDMYLHHCAQHETARKLLEAQVETRRLLKSVAKKREKQYAEAAAAQQLAMLSQTPGPSEQQQEASDKNAKRKRETEAGSDDKSKKPRRESTTEDTTMGEAPPSTTSQPKRDRENATIVVQKLPVSATEATVKRFFRDCGEILSTTIVSDPNKQDEATATIEFASKEDVLTAQTKDMKFFEGRPIKITVGTKTTLFVANYPPTADEKYIRNLFSRFGEITQVRFPSLKFNSHRRFCYVQFLTSAEAEAATQMDGKVQDKGLPLTAKISDPNAKKNRESATEEGRELYVGNLNRDAREAQVQQHFSSAGVVDSVRIPVNMKGQSKGVAFVVFHTKEEAQAALAMNNTDFMDRILKVTLSQHKAQVSSTTIINNKNHTSASPAPSSVVEGGGAASPPADDTSMPDASAASSPAPSNNHQHGPNTSTERSHHSQRSMALLQLPDTVNSARIQSLCEAYGSLVKIVLRPDHGGALVEFEDDKTMGRASLALDGMELEKGVKLRVGPPGALFRSRAYDKNGSDASFLDASGTQSYRNSGASHGNGNKKSNNNKTSETKAFLPPSKPISRPTQVGGGKKRGGRGGLGYRGGPAASSSRVVENGDSSSPASVVPSEPSHGRTQDDFRALLAGAGSKDVGQNDEQKQTNGAVAAGSGEAASASADGKLNGNGTR